ncbi:T9SS type B sorting domain-containing protein [Winogradskyella sp. A3E31]|uniref:T9SS type B sorting domain-containing protein n=1 Tax=Winogradskyella sp. A3E31 TaxID=3349637 RepID=UPI00398ABB42
MKKFGLLILLLCFAVASFGQNEASFWYFGQRAGLQFNSADGSVTAITNGQLNTLEGCTSISDTSGNLLFYSDGRTVWNRNHQVMQNGTGLKGDESSTSSGLFVPKPQDPNFYYIFTVDEPHHFNSASFPNQTDADGINDGLMYSLINLNGDGGLGSIEPTEKNVPLVTYDSTNPTEVDYKCSEKITAVKADDCFSFWVITHFVDRFYAFKVDTNGVTTTPVVSIVGPTVPAEGYRRNALGYLKASPDGTKLAVAHFGFSNIVAQDAPGGVYLFDFNNDTGVVSNSIELLGPDYNSSPYGIEFSAENKKVYATTGLGIGGGGQSQVLQWDLESADIPASLQIVHSSNNISAGALQLGLDKRIYRAQVNFQDFNTTGKHLGIINNPELTGNASNYDEFGIRVDVNNNNAHLSRIGLPPFIQSLFNTQIDIIQNGESTTELKLCAGDSYVLTAEEIAGADYTWTKDGTPLVETTFELFVDTPGFYEVFIEPNNGDCPIEGNAVVGVFEVPVANTTDNLRVCDTDNDGVVSFNFTNKDSDIIGNQDQNQFSVTYFENQIDADNNENPITFPFTNTENPQQIVARISNIENANCFDTTSFTVDVFDTPIANPIPSQEFCDNEGDTRDGISTVNLTQFEDVIYGNQDQNAYSITFHSSVADANNNQNPLPADYTNSNPFSEVIFFRIENNLNTDCYDIGNFNVSINPAPMVNDASILQCDEDDVQDERTIFNIRQIESDITGGATEREVTYFLSQTDAESEVSTIDPSSFENTSNPQLIVAKVTNTLTGCIDYAEVELRVSVTNSNDALLEACDDDGTEDGLYVFTLSDANAQVLDGLPTGLNVVYYETYEDALLENNSLANNYTNTVDYNHTVFARVENENACYGISELTLVVKRLPNIETEFETIYCLNFFPETLTLTGGVIDDNPSNYYYDWSTGESTSQIEVDAPGTYTVRVTNVEGCFKDRTITVLPSNIATITNINVVDATENNVVTVIVTGEGDYEFALDNPDGPYQDSNTFENVAPGLHTVYVRDKNDCGIIEDLVSVIGFPKFFTPNNDGRNDFWQVKGISSQFQANTIIYIFDRYGKLLKELNPLGSGWDGRYNGNIMPTSDYWFSVTLEDGRQFSSHFTLKR